MPPSARAAYLVIDLGFGDQGKGTLIDFLAHATPAHTVVRFNGGAQAGHNVVTADGRHHTFSQFGAASFLPHVETFLAATTLVDPWSLVVEADHLTRKHCPDVLARTRVDARALVTTPLHRAANRLRETARGDARHGSCGMGIGETASDALTLPSELVVRVGDLRDRASLRRKLFALHEHKRAALDDLLRALPHDADRALYDDPSLLDRYLDALPRFTDRVGITDERDLAALLARPGALLFEGAQGVLLDEWRGFHPYTTWSTCTPHNALALLADYDAPVHRIGVLRAYATRHGAGPFPTEDDTLKAALAESHNVTDPWQGRFRVGHFDVPLARYAIEACEGIDHLAITCLDRVAEAPTWQLAHQHHAPNGNVAVTLPLTPHGDLDALARLTDTVSALQPQYEITTTTGDAEAHLRAIEAHLGPVTLTSYGRTAGDKRWRHPMTAHRV